MTTVQLRHEFWSIIMKNPAWGSMKSNPVQEFCDYYDIQSYYYRLVSLLTPSIVEMHFLSDSARTRFLLEYGEYVI